MTEAATGSWGDDLSGRERVRAVVEMLDGPATVQEIADRAAVSRTTADDELERLAADNWVRKTLVDGKKGYDLNPSKLFFDELMNLIAENSRDDLEAQLEQLQEEREALQREFEADSLAEFRERLADDEDLSAEEIREARNVAATWEMLDTEITLVRHALHLYSDVADLSTAEPSETPIFS